MHCLQELSCAVVQVNDASMLALRYQTCLTDLDLRDCAKLTDEGVAFLQGMPFLSL